MTSTGSAEDDVGIPDFLIVTQEEVARRRAWNDAHPVAATFSGETDEHVRERETARLKLEEQKKADAYVKQANKKAAAAIDDPFEYVAPAPGMVWDTSKSCFVRPYQMTRAKYERLLEQMPNESCRQKLSALYESGQGASVGDDVANASHVDTAATVKTAKSRVKPAGRSRKPDDSTGGEGEATERHVQPAAGPKPARLPKEQQVAAVEALLGRPEGATLGEIGAAMGWLEPSASAFISRAFRNQGRPTTREVVEGRGSVYRLETK